MDWYLYYIRANNFVYIRSERAAAANSTQKRNMFQINFIYFVELSQVMPWATSIVSLSSRESDVVAIVVCGNRVSPSDLRCIAMKIWSDKKTYRIKIEYMIEHQRVVSTSRISWANHANKSQTSKPTQQHNKKNIHKFFTDCSRKDCV